MLLFEFKKFYPRSPIFGEKIIFSEKCFRKDVDFFGKISIFFGKMSNMV